jgi:hypothetical protein
MTVGLNIDNNAELRNNRRDVTTREQNPQL